MSIRMDAKERKQELSDAAYKIAQFDGLKAVKRVAVAAETGTTVGLINRYFGGRDGLRMDVMQRAIKDKNISLVADAIKLDLEIDIPPRLRKEALGSMAAA